MTRNAPVASLTRISQAPGPMAGIDRQSSGSRPTCTMNSSCPARGLGDVVDLFTFIPAGRGRRYEPGRVGGTWLPYYPLGPGAARRTGQAATARWRGRASRLGAGASVAPPGGRVGKGT